MQPLRLILPLCALALAPACARTPPETGDDAFVNELQKELINPPGTESVYRDWQYSQAVRSGSLLWVSGQVGFDVETGQIPDDLEAQTRLAFRNLENVISEAGGSLTDVVEIVSYHTDMREFPVFARVKGEYFVEGFPAWTAVGVTGLVDPRAKVEIRATVVIGSGPAIEEPVEEEDAAPQSDT